MVRYLTILCVFLAVCVALCFWRITYLSEKNITLTGEKKALADEIERRNQNEVEISQRKTQLKSSIRSDTSTFDWGFNISNLPAIDELRKQCKSCKR